MYYRSQPKIDTDLLFGVNAILSALQANKRKFIKAYFPKDVAEISGTRQPPVRDELQKIKTLLNERKIPIEFKYKYELKKLSENRPHNGVLLEASPLTFTSVSALGHVEAKHVHIHKQTGETMTIARHSNDNLPPLFVYLDGLWDPHNVGAILRTCFYLGVTGVLYPTRDTCPLNAVVTKTSAGALEWISLYKVPHPIPFFQTSTSMGWCLRSTSPNPSSSSVSSSQALDVPSILLLGNEHHGVASKFHSVIHVHDWIPSRLPQPHPWTDSLNVSVAAGMVLARLLAKPPF
ncbi:hypothetical protein HMI54_015818 [Coelomomyces lativittatus]|nr:hypothetical protein HMI54_015818 [Coelomomyces lativittatus]KAJ1512726.1 hypothetical protein HMI56_003642 [Coelomomyces lativittatus]KAJ1516938.1 hypothetical protein HMI55_001016 [Coelomomyces lativittatus]